MLEALKMDEAHTAIAVAAGEQRILYCLIIAPADFALNLIVFVCDATVNLDHFFLSNFVFLASPLTCHIRLPLDGGAVITVQIGGHAVGSKIFDGEFESTHLDGIASINTVLIFKPYFGLGLACRGLLIVAVGISTLRFDISDNYEHLGGLVEGWQLRYHSLGEILVYGVILNEKSCVVLAKGQKGP